MLIFRYNATFMPSSTDERQATEAWSQHTYVDVFSCAKERLDDEAILRDFSNRLCALLGFERHGDIVIESFGGPIEKRDPRIYGPSSYQIIERGGVYCHLPVDREMVCVDVEKIGSDQEFDARTVAEHTKKFFEGNRYQMVTVPHGVPNSAPAIRNVLDSARVDVRWIMEHKPYVSTNPTPEKSTTMQVLTRSFDTHNSWGQLTTIDLHGCKPALITNVDHIRKYIEQICSSMVAKRYKEPFIKHFGAEGKYNGITFYQFIETSGISGHFSPNLQKAIINAFSCRGFQSKYLARQAQEIFEADSYVTATTLRGATDSFPKFYHNAVSTDMSTRWDMKPESEVQESDQTSVQ